ncbi:unnamed protein product, partial [Prunus brigantina]
CSEAENFGSVTTSLKPQATAKRKKNKSKNQRRFTFNLYHSLLSEMQITVNKLQKPTKGRSFALCSCSEHHAKLGRVGATGGEDLPAAGLEVFGNGAVSGESDIVGGSGDRPEFKDCDVGGSRHLNGAVHARSLDGFRSRVGLGFGFGVFAFPP